MQLYSERRGWRSEALTALLCCRTAYPGRSSRMLTLYSTLPDLSTSGGSLKTLSSRTEGFLVRAISSEYIASRKAILLYVTCTSMRVCVA
ncbi:hypothetical protein GQ54DRAFT_147623 [Martensiomyces pterosporus]|nr:hypothetical protein GQ54DRAFT_147623 [Martensiomyces pterosporus]